jgi:hypothetical protein
MSPLGDSSTSNANIKPNNNDGPVDHPSNDYADHANVFKDRKVSANDS